MQSRLIGRALIAAVLAACCVTTVSAQTYPDRPIKMIAPFPAGGLADILARAVSDELTKALGQPIIVENRAGAGGNIGADAAAKSTPDGYTLLMTSAGILTANQFLYAKMPFDAETAFVPVSNVAEMPMLLVVNPKVEAKTVQEFLTLARAQPDKLNFGSPGIGTTGHLGLAVLMHAGNVKLTHVPYRGAAPAITDLLGGQIEGVVDNPPTVLSHIAEGKLRPLVVAGKQRLAQLPEVPTAAEAGLPSFEASSWFGVVVPAGTPPAIVARLHQEIAKALRLPAMQERFAKSGAQLLGNSPDEFAKQIRDDRTKWGEIIRAANIKAE